MPTPIDRHRLHQLLTDEQGQLIEVLPAAEYEDEHLPARSTSPSKSSTARRPGGSTAAGR
jgi:rhodanese-related sulfurtransferase